MDMLMTTPAPLPPLTISHEELAALIAWNSAQQQAAVLVESYGLAQRHKDRAGQLVAHGAGESPEASNDLRGALCNLRNAVEAHIAASDLGEGWDETIAVLKTAEEDAMGAILRNPPVAVFPACKAERGG